MVINYSFRTTSIGISYTLPISTVLPSAISDSESFSASFLANATISAYALDDVVFRILCCIFVMSPSRRVMLTASFQSAGSSRRFVSACKGVNAPFRDDSYALRTYQEAVDDCLRFKEECEVFAELPFLIV